MSQTNRDNDNCLKTDLECPGAPRIKTRKRVAPQLKLGNSDLKTLSPVTSLFLDPSSSLRLPPIVASVRNPMDDQS